MATNFNIPSPFIMPNPRSMPAGRGGFGPQMGVPANPFLPQFGVGPFNPQPFSVPSVPPQTPPAQLEPESPMNFIQKAMQGALDPSITAEIEAVAERDGHNQAQKLIGAIDAGVADPKLARTVQEARGAFQIGDIEGLAKAQSKIVDALARPRFKEEPGTYILDMLTGGRVSHTWRTVAADIVRDIAKREFAKPGVEEILTIPGMGPERLIPGEQYTPGPIGFGGGEEGPNEEDIGVNRLVPGARLGELQTQGIQADLAARARGAGRAGLDENTIKLDLFKLGIQAWMEQNPGKQPTATVLSEIGERTFGVSERVPPPTSARGQKEAVQADVARRTADPKVDKAFQDVFDLQSQIEARDQATTRGRALLPEEIEQGMVDVRAARVGIENIQSMIEARKPEERFKLLRERIDILNDQVGLAVRSSNLADTRAALAETELAGKVIMTLIQNAGLSNPDKSRLMKYLADKTGLKTEVPEGRDPFGKPNLEVPAGQIPPLPRPPVRREGGRVVVPELETDAAAQAEADKFLQDMERKQRKP